MAEQQTVTFETTTTVTGSVTLDAEPLTERFLTAGSRGEEHLLVHRSGGLLLPMTRSESDSLWAFLELARTQDSVALVELENKDRNNLRYVYDRLTKLARLGAARMPRAYERELT